MMENPAEENSGVLNKEQRGTTTNLWDLLPEPTAMPMKMPNGVAGRSGGRRKRNGSTSSVGSARRKSRSNMPLHREPSTMHLSANKEQDVDPTKKTSADFNYLDLMGNTMGTRTVTPKVLGPCLKKETSTKRVSLSKSVRFAVNQQGRVWCLTRTFRKAPKASHGLIWWNEQEFSERSELDDEIVEDEEEEYSEVLQQAYESVSKANAKTKIEDVDLSFADYASCNDARGLESDCFEGIAANTAKHRKGVLKAIKLIQKRKDNEDEEEDDADFIDNADAKIIRLQSLKYSRKSLLVAQKLAHFDHLITQELGDDDSLYSEEDGMFDSTLSEEFQE
mmetsp:Transcript_3382/g.7074  ORF Transcript_3382/g.7074 Transcript_3382/m.7074 type:complete len:335 (+) Transcript_3382:310-1314(+)